MIREYIVKISDEVMESEIADNPQEVVRCKDCKKRGFDDCPVNGWMPNKADGDWFCADGVRKDG